MQCPILWYAKVCALPSARSSFSSCRLHPLTSFRGQLLPEAGGGEGGRCVDVGHHIQSRRYRGTSNLLELESSPVWIQFEKERKRLSVGLRTEGETFIEVIVVGPGWSLTTAGEQNQPKHPQSHSFIKNVNSNISKSSCLHSVLFESVQYGFLIYHTDVYFIF